MQAIYTIRGAGIGFFLSSLLFVFTWSPWAFAAIPAGAVIGYTLSRVPQVGRRFARLAQAGGVGRVGSVARCYLAHDKGPVRFASLLAVGSILFLLAWSVGYYLLPEGVLRSGAEMQLESRGLDVTADTVPAEWGRILLNNLLPVALIILSNLVLRVNGIPLGYIIPLFNLMGYGLFIGTNSFAIPYPERLAPTPEILGRAGPYEMIALVMVAAATATWSLFEVKRLFARNPEKVSRRSGPTWGETGMLLLGVLLLGAAAWIEASMIVAVS